MKRRRVLLQVLLAILLVLPLSGCGEKEQEQESDDPNAGAASVEASEPNQAMLIRPGSGVGKVDLGMSVDEVRQILGKPDLDVTGVSIVYADQGFEVIHPNDKVHSINCVHHIDLAPNVKTCPYRTPEGIGIGSTEADVIAAYGEPDIRESVGTAYEIGLRFEFTDGKVSLIGVLKPWQKRN